MVNGADHAGTIALGDLDPWTSTAAQGDHLVVGLGETGTFNVDFVPWIRVFTPTGVLVAQNYRNQAAQVDFLAPAVGGYTVVVGTADAGYDGLGDYRINLAKVPGAFIVPAGDEGGALQTSTTHTGTITLRDVDSWTFGAVQNERFVIVMTETGTPSTEFGPYIRVFGPREPWWRRRTTPPLPKSMFWFPLAERSLLSLAPAMRDMMERATTRYVSLDPDLSNRVCRFAPESPRSRRPALGSKTMT